jgi:hypothetical protein
VAETLVPISAVSVPKAKPRRRRRKPAELKYLYPTEPDRRPAQVHAEALLRVLVETCDAGWYPHDHINRWYQNEVCKENGWKPLHWTAVGRALGALTRKDRRGANRVVAYFVPGSLRSSPRSASEAMTLSAA